MDKLSSVFGSSPALPVMVPSGGSSSSSKSPPPPVTSVEVHPIVLFSILDHHTRRGGSATTPTEGDGTGAGGSGGTGAGAGSGGGGRVIGTLLGRRTVSSLGSTGVSGSGGSGGTGSHGSDDLWVTHSLEVTNCFAVPHAERGDEVAIGKDFNRQMLALHHRASSSGGNVRTARETVVGWYATSSSSAGSTATSSLIHEFYAGECGSSNTPVHLVVELVTDEAGVDRISVRAYRSAPVSIRNEPLANLFHEVAVRICFTESERICVDRMIRQSSHAESNDNDNEEDVEDDDAAAAALLPQAMERLYGLLEDASRYVDAVVDGQLPPDETRGRTIADTLSSVPRIRPETFDKMFNDSLQDLLMVTYLSNITRTQLTIAEKLNATLGV